MDKKTIDIVPERDCGGCTACCEGWLQGEAHGQKFYRGRPCHFKTENGCGVYESRPHDPCVTFKCLWLENKEIPYWLKPNLSRVIIDRRVTKSNIPYINAREMDRVMDSKVLSWLVQYAINKELNLFYTVDQGSNCIGSIDFLNDMKKEDE